MLQYLSCLVYDDINCIEMRTIVMNEKVLQTLEYNKIIEQLVTYAASPSGREACRTLKPQTDSRAARDLRCPDSHPDQGRTFLLWY